MPQHALLRLAASPDEGFRLLPEFGRKVSELNSHVGVGCLIRELQAIDCTLNTPPTSSLNIRQRRIGQRHRPEYGSRTAHRPAKMATPLGSSSAAPVTRRGSTA
jgi:hypothetical protein